MQTEVSSFNLQPVRLEGQHIVLEPLGEQHLDGLKALFEPTIWRWYTNRMEKIEDLDLFLSRKISENHAGQALNFAVREKLSGHYVGHTSFMRFDAGNRKLEVGSTWYAPQWQHTFVNTEAKLLLFTHAFETLACVRVELQTDVLNERSRQAILKLGAKFEGVLRANRICFDGRLRDSACFSVLVDEWASLKVGLEERLHRLTKNN